MSEEFLPPEEPIYVEPIDSTPVISGTPVPKLIQKKVIRHHANPDDIAVAPKRELDYEQPTAIYEIHIKDGIAGCSIMKYPDIKQVGFVDKFIIGEAKAVSIAFDGRWHLIGDVTRITTYEKPQIFWVDNNDILWTQLWDESDTKLALAGDVKQVKAVRGWKSGIDPLDDQGLMVAYVRSNDWVYYRNYVQTGVNSFLWYPEERLTEFDGITGNLNVFLTNDYRIGIMIESETTRIKRWYISERNYLGTSVPDEYIDVALTDYAVTLTPIMNWVIGDGDYPVDNPNAQAGRFEWEDENISCDIVDYKTTILWASETLPIIAENVESTVFQEEIEIGSTDGIETEFETIWYPLVENTEIVKLDETIQTRDIDYTMDYELGKIIFSSTPVSGQTVSISHDWLSMGHKIKITFAHGIYNGIGLEGQFTIVDNELNNYIVTNTELGDLWTNPNSDVGFNGTKELLIRTNSFNGSISDLTVDFTGSIGTLLGEAGQDVDTFQIIFKPVNLNVQRITVDAPEVEVIFNE